MKRYDERVDQGLARDAGRHGGGADCPLRKGRWDSRGAHGAAAHALAVEDGLLSEEVDEILAGRRMVVAFPVGWREDPQEYAVRAVAEMMVAYLAFEGGPANADVRPLPGGRGRVTRTAGEGAVRA